MISRIPTRAAWLLALMLVAYWTPQPAQAAKRPAADNNGPVVKLSPFEVSAESMEFDNWNKYVSPHYVVYTDASTKEATELVRHMEMLRQAAQDFFRRRGLHLAPVIAILPMERSDWRKLHLRYGQGGEASAFWGTRNIVLIQYDWQSLGLAPLWGMLGCREATNTNMSGPPWFESGLRNFFMTVEFGGNSITLGKQGQESNEIARYGWMDWRRFFGVTSAQLSGRKIAFATGSPKRMQNNQDYGQFTAQSGALLHYALINSDPAWLTRLLSWAAYLDAGNEPTEARFKEVFQTDWAGLQKAIDKTLSGATYNSVTLNFPPSALQFSIDHEHVTPREIRELFVLGRILNLDTEESMASLDALLARGLKTESLRDVLVDACARRGRDEAELTELRALIAGGSANPAVYARAAEVQFRKAIPELALDARVGDEAEEIRTLCKRTLELEPLYTEANETLAWTEALGPTVEAANVASIGEICHRMSGTAPTDAALTAYAIARWRAGNAQQARALAVKLKDSIYTRSSAKELVTDLIARIDNTVQPSGKTATQP